MNRNSNIELLRLVLMLFIVIHHGITHGLGLDSFSSWGGKKLLVAQEDLLIITITNSFLIFSVNTFLLISGYFSIKPSVTKISKLIVPLILYTILFTIIPHICESNYIEAIRNCFVLSNGPYWFILDYFFLMILTPIINVGYDYLNKKQSIKLLICLLVINCYFGFIFGNKVNNNGYSLMQFILMYIIGRHIRKHGMKIQNKSSILVYIFCSFILGIAFWTLTNYHFDELAWKLTYYNNPIVILCSICFFLPFLSLNINSKCVNYLSASALSLYLIQNTHIVSDLFYRFTAYSYDWVNNIYLTIILLIFISVLICCISIFIDKM